MADRHVVKKGSFGYRLVDTKTGVVIGKVNLMNKDARINLGYRCEMLNKQDRVSSIANDKESRDEGLCSD